MAYQKCLQTITKKACEWIELDIENYSLSVKAFMEDKEKREEVTRKDTEVRAAIEQVEITHAEDVIIKASKFKFKRDMDMFRKLQSLKFTTAPQAQAEI